VIDEVGTSKDAPGVATVNVSRENVCSTGVPTGV
jgi:hypothetical protein